MPLPPFSQTHGSKLDLGVPETGPLEIPKRPTQWQYRGLLSWSADQWNSVHFHWGRTATHRECSNDHKEIAANSKDAAVKVSKVSYFWTGCSYIDTLNTTVALLCHMWGTFRSLETAIKTSEAIAQAEMPGRENMLTADEYWNVRGHFQPCYIVGFPKWIVFLIQSLPHSKCWIKLYILTSTGSEEHHNHFEETS